MADRDPGAPDPDEPDEEPDEQPDEQPDVQQVVRPVVPDEPPVIPDRSSDERDEGWGGRGDGGDRDDDWYERERPPHW